MQLKPDEFWNLTPLELADMIEGLNFKYDIEMKMLAWHAANLINIHVKKKVTIDKLLGNEKKKQKRSNEEIKAKIVRVEEFLKRKGGGKNG